MAGSCVTQVMDRISIGGVCAWATGTPLYIVIRELRARASSIA